MAPTQAISTQDDPSAQRNIAIGIWAIFVAEFVSLLFANARNIAQPGMIAEFNGMALFSWLIALPGLAGAAATLLFGKLSDVYGRRTIILLSIAIFSVGLAISAMSTSMVFLVAATTFMTIGHFRSCHCVLPWSAISSHPHNGQSGQGCSTSRLPSLRCWVLFWVEWLLKAYSVGADCIGLRSPCA